MPDPNVDLAELERAFAQDPTSDAFLALSRAYLEQSRFMEAMVVCKKGIKSQPDSLEGRLLLAQVYAGQGKLPKAQKELEKSQEAADNLENELKKSQEAADNLENQHSRRYTRRCVSTRQRKNCFRHAMPMVPRP